MERVANPFFRFVSVLLFLGVGGCVSPIENPGFRKLGQEIPVITVLQNHVVENEIQGTARAYELIQGEYTAIGRDDNGVFFRAANHCIHSELKMSDEGTSDASKSDTSKSDTGRIVLSHFECGLYVPDAPDSYWFLYAVRKKKPDLNSNSSIAVSGSGGLGDMSIYLGAAVAIALANNAGRKTLDIIRSHPLSPADLMLE